MSEIRQRTEPLLDAVTVAVGQMQLTEWEKLFALELARRYCGEPLFMELLQTVDLMRILLLELTCARPDVGMRRPENDNPRGAIVAAAEARYQLRRDHPDSLSLLLQIGAANREIELGGFQL